MTVPYFNSAWVALFLPMCLSYLAVESLLFLFEQAIFLLQVADLPREVLTVLFAFLVRQRVVVDPRSGTLSSLLDLLVVRKLVRDAVAERGVLLLALALARQQRDRLLLRLRSCFAG